MSQAAGIHKEWIRAMIFWNIRKQLFLLFITVSIIPVVIVSFISYNSYTSLVSNQVSKLASDTIDNTTDRIGGIIRNIDRITLSFQQFSAQPGSTTAAERLTQLNNMNDLSYYDLFAARREMMFFLDTLMLGNEYIKGIYIFLPDGHNITYSSGYDLVVGYEPSQDEWYQETLALKGGLYISEVGKKDFIINNTNSITFARALYDSDTRAMLGVLLLDCDISIFNELDKDIVQGISSIYLVDRQGVILYETSMRQIGESVSDSLLELVKLDTDGHIQTEQDGILTVMRPFPGRDWRILATIDLQELYKQYGISEKLIVYIAFTCGIIFLILSIVLSKVFTKPIFELANTMRRSKSYPLTLANKHLDRKDEIGILYREYNKMVQDLEDYIRDSYQNKLMSLDSQMKALEAQINSHFLYNTLESINSIAEIEEVESIAIMTKALGDMFRYSIKTESELVMLSDELTHVHNYMAIQKVRYEDRIRFDVQVDDHLKQQRILKLILQPVVENAIYHGIELSSKEGLIKLSAYEDEERIIFEVQDNGVGMTSEQLQELQSLLMEPVEFKELGQRNKRGIGLKNIHSRIALYYGDGYGLRIQSQKDIGTTVTITVPKIK